MRVPSHLTSTTKRFALDVEEYAKYLEECRDQREAWFLRGMIHHVIGADHDGDAAGDAGHANDYEDGWRAAFDGLHKR